MVSVEFKIPTNLEELEERSDDRIYRVVAPLEVKVMSEKKLIDMLDDISFRLANTQVCYDRNTLYINIYTYVIINLSYHLNMFIFLVFVWLM